MELITLEQRVICVRTAGLCEEDTPLWWKKFYFHKASAAQRMLVSELTFGQYLQKAVEAGLRYPTQIGRYANQYVLGRIGDVGPYTVESCRFITSSKNRQEQHENGRLDYATMDRRLSIVTARARLLGQTRETSEQIRKISNALRGRTKENHAGTRARADKLAKPFSLIDPEGRVYHGKNLLEFCRSHGLDQRSMWRVVAGVHKQHRGWSAESLN